MKRQIGLGKGFESLIPQNFDATILLDETEKVQKIALEQLRANPDQPRKHFDQKALEELASSIKQYGIVQPLVVVKDAKDGFVIIAGERRWRAAKLAGLTHVPALVRTSEQLERLELAIIENVQRVDLSPLEQAASIFQLHSQFSIEYDTIAKRLGKAPTTVSNIVRLLQLPKAAADALQAGKISEGHARAILALKDDDSKARLLDNIIGKEWTVRQAEQFVAAHKAGVAPAKMTARVADVTPETKRLAEVLKTPVSIRRLAKGGKLEIRFKTDADLARIIKRLG